MSLSVGIVGLPNSGKSTLFNALMMRQIAQVAEYPYTTIEPNVGVVEVPDERLTKIADILAGDSIASLQNDKKGRIDGRPQVIPAAIRFIDIAGLIKGAHSGEGLGNQFLAHIREVDAILHVVRVFDSSTAPAIGGQAGQAIPHVMGDIDPGRDVEVVNLELELADIKKPTIYVLNVSESQLTGESVNQLIEQMSQKTNTPVISICAKLEAELSEISEEEQKAYLAELGVNRSGLDQVIKESYKLLDLITFFTIAGGKSSSAKASEGPRQAQAWPIKKGSKIIDAAEKVHTDMARGFITAEAIDWQKLVEAGSWQEAHAKGLIHLAGRNEDVIDGEVVEFKFRV